jgi:hypothetical protein
VARILHDEKGAKLMKTWDEILEEQRNGKRCTRAHMWDSRVCSHCKIQSLESDIKDRDILLDKIVKELEEMLNNPAGNIAENLNWLIDNIQGARG